MKSYYEILGVSKNATPDQIKNAYRRLALKWHPDKNQNNRAEVEEKFKEINKIYQVLSDPEIRKMYDIYGESWKRQFNNAESGKMDKVQKKINKTILSIISEFNSCWMVEEEDLDHNLWTPKSSWKEKIRSLKEIKEVELFERELIFAIQKKREEKKSASRKKEAVDRISEKLVRNNLTVQDLKENNREYEKEIWKVGEKEVSWKIKDIESKIKENIEDIIRSKDKLISTSRKASSSSLNYKEIEKKSSSNKWWHLPFSQENSRTTSVDNHKYLVNKGQNSLGVYNDVYNRNLGGSWGKGSQDDKKVSENFQMVSTSSNLVSQRSLNNDKKLKHLLNMHGITDQEQKEAIFLIISSQEYLNRDQTINHEKVEEFLLAQGPTKKEDDSFSFDIIHVEKDKTVEKEKEIEKIREKKESLEFELREWKKFFPNEEPKDVESLIRELEDENKKLNKELKTSLWQQKLMTQKHLAEEAKLEKSNRELRREMADLKKNSKILLTDLINQKNQKETERIIAHLHSSSQQNQIQKLQKRISELHQEQSEYQACVEIPNNQVPNTR